MTVTVENVTKVVRGSMHVRDVSLSLAPGTINILLGPTLSGKTSIMRLLAGLDAPTSGRVLVDGDDVTGKPVRERSVAMVYQQFINYPVMTVYENIASPLRVRGVAVEKNADSQSFTSCTVQFHFSGARRRREISSLPPISPLISSIALSSECR